MVGRYAFYYLDLFFILFRFLYVLLLVTLPCLHWQRCHMQDNTHRGSVTLVKDVNVYNKYFDA